MKMGAVGVTRSLLPARGGRGRPAHPGEELLILVCCASVDTFLSSTVERRLQQCSKALISFLCFDISGS